MQRRDAGEILRKEAAEAGLRAIHADMARPKGRLRIGGLRGHR
jgi:hypothetical protein